jgi:hypothetical protein
MPSVSKMARLVAATPITTSAFGLAFSASRRAVMMPVESLTQVIETSGLAFSKAVWYAFSWSVSSAV